MLRQLFSSSWVSALTDYNVTSFHVTLMLHSQKNVYCIIIIIYYIIVIIKVPIGYK